MEKSKKYLSDVLMAIELIEEFIGDESDFAMYDGDQIVRLKALWSAN